MAIQKAKTKLLTTLNRADSSNTRNRGPFRGAQGLIQANGNAGRGATAFQLMMNEPAYVVWHMGVRSLAGPTIDGVELPAEDHRINICAEVLDRGRRRINRRIKGIFTIHKTTSQWGPLADSTNHLREMKYFVGSVLEENRSKPYHYGVDRNSDALDDSSEHYSTWWSGEQGYFLVGWKTVVPSTDDHYWAHITINGITYASPELNYGA
jgi:hypothetical protein